LFKEWTDKQYSFLDKLSYFFKPALPKHTGAVSHQFCAK